MAAFFHLLKRSSKPRFVPLPPNPKVFLVENPLSIVAASQAHAFQVGSPFKHLVDGGGGVSWPAGAGKIHFPARLSEQRWFSSQPVAAAVSEPKTVDGLTVDDIVAKGWPILDESEGDWRSHAAAIAQSVQLIKKRVQWKKLIIRLEQLSLVLNKPNLWDDPLFAGKISREHGELLNKIKEVKSYEHELLEHIDLIKLAREENDEELELESLNALAKMRRNAKDKELEALLSGDNDSCSCFIEVQAGAGGTESMDWASMVMNMYKSWARRRGYAVTVVEEMAAGNN